MQQVIILCPVYNDEEACNLLIAATQVVVSQIKGFSFSFLIVDDGSDQNLQLKCNLPCVIIKLHRNLGHQKAIALALSYAHKHLSYQHIVVMDCDGEDRPRDINALLKVGVTENTIVFARRTSRQNGLQFKIFYWLYKILFRLVTGKKIAFGNFMLLPSAAVNRLVYMSEIWNHLAAAIIKSGLPYATVNTKRGERYLGVSKMNFPALLLHGLGATGVFIELIAARLLIFSIAMIFISVVALVIIVTVRFFTEAAIPGWATTAFSAVLIVLLQCFLLSLFTIFLNLSAQAQRRFIPAKHFDEYIASVETI